MAGLLKYTFPLHCIMAVIIYSSTDVFSEGADKSNYILDMIPSIKEYVEEAIVLAGDVAEESSGF